MAVSVMSHKAAQMQKLTENMFLTEKKSKIFVPAASIPRSFGKFYSLTLALYK